MSIPEEGSLPRYTDVDYTALGRLVRIFGRAYVFGELVRVGDCYSGFKYQMYWTNDKWFKHFYPYGGRAYKLTLKLKMCFYHHGDMHYGHVDVCERYPQIKIRL